MKDIFKRIIKWAETPQTSGRTEQQDKADGGVTEKIRQMARKNTTPEHARVSGQPSGEYCPQCRIMSGKMTQLVITERDIDMIKGTLKLECPECGHIAIKIP